MYKKLVIAASTENDLYRSHNKWIYRRGNLFYRNLIDVVGGGNTNKGVNMKLRSNRIRPGFISL